MGSFASGFAKVDTTTDCKSFVQYLDLIHSLPFFQERKKESFLELGIHSGDTILEVGCGNGIDAWKIAELAGPDGHVVGIDISNTMLVSARDNALSGSSSPHFMMSNAIFLPFTDRSFDGVRTDRVLQHTKNPAGAIREMTRVLRTSGKIVLFEPDWDTYGIWPGDQKVVRKIIDFWCDQIPSGWVGRSLYSGCVHADLHSIEIKPSILTINDLNIAKSVFDIENTILMATRTGIITPKEAKVLVADLQEADRNRSFFSSLVFYMVTGVKN